MWEIICSSTPYNNFKNQQEILKFVLIDNGRPSLELVPADCPPEVDLFYYS